jgi:O-antigen biosynthesis protein
MNYNSLIVVVTYNSENFIERCLRSIITQDYKNWFLVIIDNASCDKTVAKISEFKNMNPIINSSNFKLMALKKNIGFAAAVNYAVFNFVKAKGKDFCRSLDFLILLNPDIYINSSSLGKMVSFYNIAGKRDDSEKFPEGKIGAAGGLILDYEKNTVQHLGGMISDNFITSHIDSGKDYSVLEKELKESGSSENKVRSGYEIKEVDYVTGAFFVTEFGLFISLGGFDAGYRPAYFEELDYCLKLRKTGRRIAVNPDSVAMHFEGASVKKFSGNFYKFYHKNRIRCAIINLDFLSFLKVFIAAEFRWIRNESTPDQSLSLLYAYLINFLFLPYNLIIKLKNHLILNKLELK